MRRKKGCENELKKMRSGAQAERSIFDRIRLQINVLASLCLKKSKTLAASHAARKKDKLTSWLRSA